MKLPEEMLDKNHIVVVTDGVSSYQALYRGGRRRFVDSTIYAGDIAEEVGSESVRISHLIAEMPEEEEFPKQLEDLAKWI